MQRLLAYNRMEKMHTITGYKLYNDIKVQKCHMPNRIVIQAYFMNYEVKY